jgi:chemotaxis protein MotB
MPLPSEPKPSAADDDFGSSTLAAVEWNADDREDNWLISYADLLSVIFTMVVLLFGRMTVVAETPAEQASGAEPSQHVAAVVEKPPVEPVAADAPLQLAVTAPAAEPVAPQAEAPTLAASSAEPSAGVEGPPAPTSEADAESAVAAAEVATADTAPNDPQPPPSAGPAPEDRVADLIEQRFRGQIAATRREHGLEITIPEVALFASARAALQESARPVLAELAATLREGGAARISVEGHTDNVPVQGGQFASNWDLASARANAVARYLLEQGFEPSRLQSVSFADTRPVASNDNEQGRAANRRVELQIGFIDGN